MRVCGEVIGSKALGYVVVDNEIIVGTTQSSLEESGCRFCGDCVEVCPTGALRDKELKPGDRRAALIPCVARCPVEMLRWAIPEYRLPRSVISQEIEDIKAMGVEILTNTPIKSENFLKDLKLEAWDALFLATGAQESEKIDVEGLSLDGVYWGLEFLRGTKEGKMIWECN